MNHRDLRCDYVESRFGIWLSQGHIEGGDQMYASGGSWVVSQKKVVDQGSHCNSWLLFELLMIRRGTVGITQVEYKWRREIVSWV